LEIYQQGKEKKDNEEKGNIGEDDEEELADEEIE